MASVPSAGCLLAARNQYHKNRRSSTSSVSSNGSCCMENAPEQEKPQQDFLLTVEKCWWLKNFLNCELPHHPINTELSAGSAHR